jgi:hypothetical protein
VSGTLLSLPYVYGNQTDPNGSNNFAFILTDVR